MSGGKIYLREKDGLVPMSEAPYDAEDILQALLAEYPDLLAGDQMRPSEPRRWLLISREAGVPDSEGGQPRWSLDHLFIDQDAVPTLVEVKRSTDTRIRREVVGQMLDYAANILAYWPGLQLRQVFEDRPRAGDTTADEEVLELLGLSISSEEEAAHVVDEYWQRAASNLAARQIRLVFVADAIASELQRVVEFLNENLVRAEVLAVEVKQYVGEGRQTLVPRVIGRTAAAEDVKQTSGGTPRRTWIEPDFLEATATTGGSEAVSLVQAALAWNRQHGTEIVFGKGKFGPLYYLAPDAAGALVKIANVNTQGHTMLSFDVLVKFAPFDQVDKRVEMARRLNEIPGVQIPERHAVGASWPSIRLEALSTEAARSQFLDALDWAARELLGKP